VTREEGLLVLRRLSEICDQLDSLSSELDETVMALALGVPDLAPADELRAAPAERR
jgi:hypothetical protein